jgi:hypothetical protein
VRKMIYNGAPPVVIVPADLTAARIRRVNPSLSKEAARQMAAELHDIIAGVRKYCAARSSFSAADVNDLIQTMMRGIVDDQPRDAAVYDAGASDSIYLATMLTADSDDHNDLYLRFIRLFDRVNGTDVVGECGLDDKPSAKKPELCLVRDDIPSLDAIMQALIAAVRLAQSGKGPTKILDLLPAFKESVELDFIMRATEAHRGALFDLLQEAGIPIA